MAQLVEAPRYTPKGRGFDSRSCRCYVSLTWSFRPHYGPGVDSVSNRNEYQEYFLGGKGGRYVGLSLPPSCAVSRYPQSPGLSGDCFTFYMQCWQGDKIYCGQETGFALSSCSYFRSGQSHPIKECLSNTKWMPKVFSRFLLNRLAIVSASWQTTIHTRARARMIYVEVSMVREEHHSVWPELHFHAPHSPLRK